MRSLIWIPLTIALLAAAAWAVARGIHRSIPTPELITASVITIVSVELALMPMVLARGGGTAAVSQASLLSTLIHLFLSISIAGGAYMLHLFTDRSTFLYILVAFFWVSLVLLVAASVRAIRAAEAAAPQPPRPSV